MLKSKYIAYPEWSVTGELYSLSKQVQKSIKRCKWAEYIPVKITEFLLALLLCQLLWGLQAFA